MPTPQLPYKTTALMPHLENMYQLWASNNAIPQSNDYDMKGFYLGGLLNDPKAETNINPSDHLMHFNDKWKLPNHESFSNESMYATAKDDPRWIKPSPYKNGTWAQLGKHGLLNIEIPN